MSKEKVLSINDALGDGVLSDSEILDLQKFKIYVENKDGTIDGLRDIQKNQMHKDIDAFLSKLDNIEGFDKTKTKAKISRVVDFVLMDAHIPEIAKSKFVSDFYLSLSFFDKTQDDFKKDIKILKSQRKSRTGDKEDEEGDGYFLDILIFKNFLEPLQLRGTILQRCFVDDSVSFPNGKTYHQKTLQTFLVDTKELDKKYGLEVGESLFKPGVENEGIEISQESVQSRLSEFVSKAKGYDAKKLMEDAQRGIRPSQEDIQKNEEIKKIVLEYMDIYKEFKRGQVDQFESYRSTILGKGPLTKVFNKGKEALGITDIWVEQGIENRFQEKTDNMSMNELMNFLKEILRNLPSMAPVVGNAYSAVMTFEDIFLHNGVNRTGEQMTGMQMAFAGILDIGLLPFDVVGASKLGKLKKLEVMYRVLNRVLTRFKNMANSLSVAQKFHFLESFSAFEYFAPIKSLLTHLKSTLSPMELAMLTSKKLGIAEHVAKALDKLRDGKKLEDFEMMGLFGALTKNFPYVNILRMGKGDVVRSFHFGGIGGIKKLNDRLGQLFTDDVSAIIRSRILQNLKEGFGEEAIRRVIRADHKGLALSLKGSDIPLEEFWKVATKGLDVSTLREIPEIRNILEKGALREFMIGLKEKGIKEFKGFSTDTEQLDKKILSCPECFEELKNAILNPKGVLSKDDTMAKRFVEKRMHESGNVLDYMHINLGESTVAGSGPKKKLEAFAAAQRMAVISAVEHGSGFMKFDSAKLLELINDVETVEKKILSKVGQTFDTFDGKKALIVIQSSSGDYINPALLIEIRKGVFKGDAELFSLTDEYIKKLTAVADNIKAGLYDTLDVDFEIAQKLDNIMKKVRERENLSPKEMEVLDGYLKINQKGFMTRQTFKDLMAQKKGGTLGFTDIKNLWADNMIDFRNTMKNMKRADGTLDFEQILKSGDTVTSKLRSFISDLKNAYGDRITISVGGDEIYRHIDGDFDKSHFSEILQKYNLNARTSYRKLENAETVVDIQRQIESLDKSTMLTKILEGIVGNIPVNFNVGELDASIFSKDLEAIKKGLLSTPFHRALDEFCKHARQGDNFLLGLSSDSSKKYVVLRERDSFEILFVDKSYAFISN